MNKIRQYEFIVKFLIKIAKILPNGLPLIIIRGPLRGYKWIIGAAAGEAKGLSIIFNLIEKKQLNIANIISIKKGICFDIGANVGLYSLLFSKNSKSVYAFEPLPRNVYFLKRTLMLNKVRNVFIIPMAVSDKNGFSMFQKGINYSTGKLNKSGDFLVKTITLDSFVRKRKIFPNILKIDVEGSELVVIKGAKNLLVNYKPIILLSTHGNKIKIECLKYLKNLRYKSISPINANSIEEATEFIIRQ